MNTGREQAIAEELVGATDRLVQVEKLKSLRIGEHRVKVASAVAAASGSGGCSAAIGRRLCLPEKVQIPIVSIVHSQELELLLRIPLV